MDSSAIDLNRAEQAVVSLTSDGEQGYQPRTLHQHNTARRGYLPIFPTASFSLTNCLLLANVPVTHLGPHQIARREHGAYTPEALMLMNNYHYSGDFSLSQQDAVELSVRLRVGMSIITFNANHLRGICYSLRTIHETFRRNFLRQEDVVLEEPTLNSTQMAIALEFFLQMDVDMFCMKTCSFRGARPRSNNIQGLFCGKDQPQGRYTLLPCSSVFCSCCHPLNQSKKSQPWPVVNFASSSRHQFVNGYTTYLNCPATCDTSNVIYAMTCPCGDYDYVDSTTEILTPAMIYHQEHGNRIIHEKLTGSPLFRGATFDPNQNENEMANKMRLYQHSARCPVALRSFLDCNPIYWCFIPLHWEEALGESVVYVREISNPEPQLSNVSTMDAIDNNRTVRYRDRVPLPPNDYAFSYRQRQQQRFFFESFLSSSSQQLPYSKLDLYKVAIIAVLPDDRSLILRYILETLFIIHGETKLNMICPFGGNPEQRYGPPYDPIWCANLNRRSLSLVSNASQIET